MRSPLWNSAMKAPILGKELKVIHRQPRRMPDRRTNARGLRSKPTLREKSWKMYSIRRTTLLSVLLWATTKKERGAFDILSRCDGLFFVSNAPTAFLCLHLGRKTITALPTIELRDTIFFSSPPFYPHGRESGSPCCSPLVFASAAE